jgi:hypothetical protein
MPDRARSRHFLPLCPVGEGGPHRQIFAQPMQSIGRREKSAAGSSERRVFDLPVGRFRKYRVYPLLQKYFASPVGQIISTNSPHPTPQEGRIMAVAKRGVGCGGRGSVERAMDRRAGSLGACERSQARGREMLLRTAKSCGPDAPMLASSLAEVLLALPGMTKPYSRGGGGKKARSPAISCTHLFISGRPVRKTRVLSTFAEGP